MMKFMPLNCLALTKHGLNQTTPCGMQVKNYNDIHVGDVLEAFQEVEVKKKLK